MMNKQTIIFVLEDIAHLLTLKDENPFKVRAYHKAARTLEQQPDEIASLIHSGKLEKLEGIGPTLYEKITQLAQTGKLDFYDELKKSIPQGLRDMTQLPGVGPKKARHLYYDLGLHSIGELEYACQENRLLKLKGFGIKTQTNLLEAIQFYRKNQEHFLYPDAFVTAQALIQVLKKNKNVLQCEAAGSLRRLKETIGDIDILVASQNPTQVITLFSHLSEVKKILSQGSEKSSVRLQNGLQADLLCVTPDDYPLALHHFTGSKEHHIQLRGWAKEKGFKLSEHGLFKGQTKIPCGSEKELYTHLGLDYIPPELREGYNEIHQAQHHTLPQLIEKKDLKGIFHIHTSYSDGRATLEEMVQAAKNRGFEYLGISDHSQSAHYAHGLGIAEIRKQQKEILSLNKKSGLPIFWGIESDILEDGSLDYPDAILAEFDFVIASVHSRFKMTESQMTQRLITAIKNPHTTMLGHMTGRLLLSRDPYPLNIKAIIDAASDYGKIIELNANPYRLDIDWRHLDYAKQKKVPIAINPDAHSIQGLDDVIYGINMARKGGLESKDVFNTQSLKAVTTFFKAHKHYGEP